MESVAVVLLLVLLGGYFVFAGSDIGLGMLLPYAARSPAERRRLIAVIAPYFLGSEVWLVATIGVVAGLVPVWEAAVVTAQWPVFVLLLAAWLGRDAGLWLRGRLPAARWRAVWDGAVAAGSWLLAVGIRRRCPGGRGNAATRGHPRVRGTGRALVCGTGGRVRGGAARCRGRCRGC